MEEGKRYAAPRQLIKWFEKLNLNHKIRNMRTSFSNGFILAEIIAQVEENVNMNQFYDSGSLQKKLQNWKIIQQLLKRKEFILTNDEIRDVIFMEEIAGLILLIRVCEFYTKVKINWELKPQNPVFNFLAPNISSLMRNQNVATIISLSEKNTKINAKIEAHKKEAREKISKMKLKDFISQKKRKFLLDEISKVKFKEAKTQIALNKNVKDENIVLLKQYQKNNNNTTKVLTFTEMKNELLVSIANVIEKNHKRFVLSTEPMLYLGIPEIKNIFLQPQQNSERPIEIILETCTVFCKTLSELYENNLPDFLSFFEIFMHFLSRLEETPLFQQKVRLLFKTIGEQFYAESDDFLVIFMENTGFKIIRDVCLRKMGKRDYFAAVVSGFMPQNEDERVRYLCQMKESFTHNLRDFTSILTRVAITEANFGKDQIYFNTLLYFANLAIKTSSPINIVNGLKIYHILVSVNCLKISIEMANLEWDRLLKIEWWEIRALLLVIISEVLKKLNQTKRDIKLRDQMKTSNDTFNNPSNSINEGEEQEKEEGYVDDRTSNHKSEPDDKTKIESPKFDNSLLNNLSSTELNQFEDNSNRFLTTVIPLIFKATENLNVVKIGLVYISELTNYYPDFATLYFDILISVSQKVLHILLSEDEVGLSLPIVLGSNSFTYLQTGVHHYWNSAVILDKMSDRITDTGMLILDKKFSQILQACLKKKLKQTKKDEWLGIFIKLETILLNSLIDEIICEEILLILKVFLSYDFICEYFSAKNEDKLFEMLKKIYFKNDKNKQKESFLSLFRFLDEEMAVTEFVFSVLKRFSESDFEVFLGSNLVEYTNKLAALRRDKIYGTGFLTSLLAF